MGQQVAGLQGELDAARAEADKWQARVAEVTTATDSTAKQLREELQSVKTAKEVLQQRVPAAQRSSGHSAGTAIPDTTPAPVLTCPTSPSWRSRSGLHCKQRRAALRCSVMPTLPWRS